MSIVDIIRNRTRELTRAGQEPDRKCDMCGQEPHRGSLVPVGGNAKVCDSCYDRIVREEQ